MLASGNRRALLRVALVAGAIACAVGLVTGINWYRQVPESGFKSGGIGGTTLPDLLWRLSTALPRAGLGRLGQDGAWWTSELAIAHYESLAYSSGAISADARVKLAIIYGNEGYTDQAAKLLGDVPLSAPHLVRASLLLSWLFGGGTKPPRVADAMSDIEARFEPWVVRACQIALAQRQGQTAAVEKLQVEGRREGVGFLRVAACLATAWLLLLLVGLGALLYWVLRWFFTPRPAVPTRRAPLVRPWRGLDALEAWAVILVAVTLARIVLHVLGNWPGVTPLQLALMTAAAYLVSAGLALAVIAFRLRHQTQGAPRLVGLLPVKPGGLGYGVLAYGAFVALLALLGVVWVWAIGGHIPAVSLGQAGTVNAARNPAAAVVYGVLAVIVAPFIEETIFRGYIYVGLRRKMPAGFAMLASALMFALTHTTLPLPAMLGIFVVGIVLAYVFERTRNLYACVGLHMTHNALVFALMLLAAL